MNGRNIRLGHVTITLLNGSSTIAYIREYTPDTLQARVMVQGTFIDARWNGNRWVQVA